MTTFEIIFVSILSAFLAAVPVILLWHGGAWGKEPQAARRRWEAARIVGADIGIPPEWYGEGPPLDEDAESTLT